MNILRLIEAVSIIQFLIVGIFLLTLKKGNRTSNLLLAGFLISKSVCYVGSILAGFNYYFRYFSIIYIFTCAVDLLLGPFLYLYTKSQMYNDFKLKLSHLLNSLPFFIFLSYFVVLFFSYPAQEEYKILEGTTIVLFLYSATYIQFIVYTTLCMIELKRFEKRLKTEYSSIEKMKLSWLFFLLIGFTAIWVVGYINFNTESFLHYVLIPWEILVFFVFVFSNAIVYKGLKQPELFSGLGEKIPLQKYAKTVLAEDKKDEYLEKILSYMENNKPYLNPTITIDEFSEKVCIPSHYTSQVLNTKLNKNFYDFINSRRVEESITYFRSKKDNTILQILYDAGFNSKASFNRAFKKHTGMTPSEFRKTCNTENRVA